MTKYDKSDKIQTGVNDETKTENKRRWRKAITMDFSDSDFKFVQDDPDVLMRIKANDGSEEVVFLTTDGDALNDKLFDVQQGAEGQWFVVVNQKLLDDRIEKSIEANAEHYGKKHAMFLPISFIIQEALREVTERQDDSQ